MTITEEQFQAFLHCETKAYLKSIGIVAQHEFTAWRRHTEEEFKQKCLSQLRAEVRDEECFAGTPSPNELKARKYRLVIDGVLQAQEFESRIHALERVDVAEKVKLNHYVPIRFIPTEKITSFDKLLLAYDGLALSAACGKKPPFGKIIHGSKQSVTKVKLPDLMDKAKAIIGKMSAKRESPAPPPLILNRHCTECEFKARCRQIAVEKDELSLLSNLSEKERKKQHSKGIFTVTQLSYTYRPRRRPKRLASKPDNYSHALRALAIRENKIHIAGSPKLNITGTPVYLDVEGVPDRDFYYLIGLRVKDGDSYIQHSFWANDVSEEKEIWASFLTALAQIENPQLVHYGSYETTFLKQMKQRYGNGVEGAIVLDRLIKEAVNVLSPIYAQIYFPTYSNSLKDIAPYLGFQWSESDASGLTSLIWRAEWESSKNIDLKQKLIIYNLEDCAALTRVLGCVYELTAKVDLVNNPNAVENKDVEIAWAYDTASPASRSDWGTPSFFYSDFDYINKCAYFDYQRERVFIRTSNNLKRGQTQTAKTKRNRKITINKRVQIKSSICPYCNSSALTRNHNKTRTKILFDLKATPTGIKGQMVACSSAQHRCLQCERVFHPFRKTSLPQNYNRADKYSHGLKSWAMYQHVVHRTSFESIEEMIKEYFGLNIRFTDIHIFKSLMAEYYRPTYASLMKKLITGRLIHADETAIKLKKSSGYVWVFTSLEEVVFMYKPSREGEFLKELLKEFKGTLISDFYGAYDSIPCAQQKCLIHLIRDLNNDLLKNPFNEELKSLARDFSSLLKPIIQTVDQFGLKAHFLRKHKAFVERFFRSLSACQYQSETGAYYQKRFEKNRDKLFTFLDHDGVPWNNNNAEHTIKQFAHYRMISDGKMTEPGLNSYLVLFSIYQTCKYKGVSFFKFLLSGERNLDKFHESGLRNRGGISNSSKLIIPNAELDF